MLTAQGLFKEKNDFLFKKYVCDNFSICIVTYLLFVNKLVRLCQLK